MKKRQRLFFFVVTFIYKIEKKIIDYIYILIGNTAWIQMGSKTTQRKMFK